MVPSRATAAGTGLLTAALTAALVFVPFEVGIGIGTVAAFFVGLAATTGVWGLPRLQWSNEGEQTAGAFEFGLVAVLSTLPTLAIVPAFLLDGVAFGTQIALVALLFGVGFTGFGGCASLLAFNHARYGGRLRFAETDARSDPTADSDASAESP